MMRKSHRRGRAEGGNISAEELSKGNASGVRSAGRTPSQTLPVGGAEAVRSGRSSKALALGASTGQPLAKGGRALNMGNQRLAFACKRNATLGEPAFAQGGAIHRSMKSLYKALHSHFEKEPHLKKLGAKASDLREGEPHRESGSEMRRAKGGRMWIQGAIKHPGALHKQLGIAKGKKIPLSRLKKAEHSKSPLLRKRAYLAETLKKLHP